MPARPSCAWVRARRHRANRPTSCAATAASPSRCRASPTEILTTLDGFAGVVWWGNPDQSRAIATALAARKGPILPLVTGTPDRGHVTQERHVCVDTTASGGNAALLAEAGNS